MKLVTRKLLAKPSIAIQGFCDNKHWLMAGHWALAKW